MNYDCMDKDYLNQGILLMTNAQYSKAKEYFKKAIEANTDNEDAYMHYGNACVNSEEYDEALEAFNKVISLNDQNATAYFNIGNVYILQNNFKKCIENYNKAEKAGLRSTNLYETLANVHLRLGDTTAALRNLTKAIKSDDLNFDLYVQKAKIYISIGKFDEALYTLDELEKIAPDAFEVYDLKTQIYTATNQLPKALDTIDTALSECPDDIVFKWIRLKVLVEMQKHDEAKEYVKEIKEHALYETVARQIAIQEATIYSFENDIPKAIVVLEDAIKYEDPVIAESYDYILMNLYTSDNRYDKAYAVADKLEKLNDKSVFNISGMFYKAYLTKLQGNIEAANARFKELCDIFRKMTLEKMNFYEAYMYRALCHKETGEYDKALELADYIENLYPERADAYAIRYGIYSTMGKEAEAEEQKKKAKEINPVLAL